MLQGSEKGGPLILHAATSTTNTVRYCDLFMSTVLPYWQSNPPSHRLTSKPYKSIWAKNSYLPEHTLTFKVRILFSEAPSPPHSTGDSRGTLESPGIQGLACTATQPF